MKTRNFYAFIILAVIIIAILIYSSRVVQPQKLEVNEAPVVEQPAPVIMEESVAPASLLPPVVTVIKPAVKREKVLPEAKHSEEIIVGENPAPLVNEASAVAGGQNSSAATDEPAAGITRLGKYPTPERAKEMNSKGIIMY